MNKLQELIDIADREYDGHFTLLKFTTDWACCFGTIENVGELNSYMQHGKTMDEAIEKCIEEDCNSFDILAKNKAIQKSIEFLTRKKKWSEMLLPDADNNYSENIYKFIKNHPDFRFVHLLLRGKEQSASDVLFTNFREEEKLEKDEFLRCYPLENILDSQIRYKQEILVMKKACSVKDISVEFWKNYFLLGQDYFDEEF